MQAKLTGNAFLDSGRFDIAVDVCHNSKWKYLCQYPGWGISVGVGLSEMDNMIVSVNRYQRSGRIGTNVAEQSVPS